MAKITLDRVCLTFRVRQQQGRLTLKEYLVRGLFLRPAVPMMTVCALQDLNLSVRPGERVGVIGHNGAGKSTLLRLLAGIYEPTRGSSQIKGRVAPVFDLGVGMDPELS